VLLATNSIGSAKLYFIAAPNVAKMASALADASGVDAFPGMSPMGGELVNSPCLVSSAVPSGELYLIDASGFAADAGPVTVDASLQADVQMDTAPSMTSSGPTAASKVSMFATNSAALRCMLGMAWKSYAAMLWP